MVSTRAADKGYPKGTEEGGIGAGSIPAFSPKSADRLTKYSVGVKIEN